MGKIRTKLIGSEEVEKKQAEKAAARRAAKRDKEQKVGESAESAESAQSDTSEQSDNVDTPKHQSIKDAQVSKKARQTKARVRGKNYRAAKKQVTSETYSIPAAVSLLKKIATATFNESFELHLNLVDANVKGEVTLPHGSGKSVKVTVVNDDVLAAIEAGNLDFDVLITHPSYMPKLAKVARILGPKGLMPNPKNGTVSEKPEEVAKKYAGGSIRFKSEGKFPLLHQVVGKKSFEDKALAENISAFLKAVNAKNIKTAYLKTTMSPSVQIRLD